MSGAVRVLGHAAIVQRGSLHGVSMRTLQMSLAVDVSVGRQRTGASSISSYMSGWRPDFLSTVG